MRGAKTLQIMGTGSGVGKSVVVAALCRVFLQDGLKVAPFKAQNMSLNSFVTKEGGEIGRAQAMQAAACRLKPSVDMNPVLLKPTSDMNSQVIVRGHPVRNMSVSTYLNYKGSVLREVMRSFNRLKKAFEVVVIEGAGSPAEVNLKSHDIVNMKMAKRARAPVILVGDIDRGGVFAWLVGTLELLNKSERKMVKGFIINKFRGDIRLLRSGLNFIEKRTGVKVLGVIPYFREIRIPEEDSLALDFEEPTGRNIPPKGGILDIAVIKLPHMSNFTDFDALKAEPDVKARYIADRDALKGADIIILPGTKNTIADLLWLKRKGLAGLIRTKSKERRAFIIGICGGYQMLGRSIHDSSSIESGRPEIEGIGILPIMTVFKKDKILAEVSGREISSGLEVAGYEIHHGRTAADHNAKSVFRIFERQGKRADEADGTASNGGRVWGTYIHGIFDKDAFRRNFLNNVRLSKGLSPLPGVRASTLDRELDKLAALVRKNIDMDSVRGILSGKD